LLEAVEDGIEAELILIGVDVLELSSVQGSQAECPQGPRRFSL